MSYLHLLKSIRPNIRYLGYLLLPLLLTAGLRESGATKQWDLLAFDRLLSLRPTESIDNRITIVTIDEADLTKQPNKSSISDQNLAMMRASLVWAIVQSTHLIISFSRS